LVLVVQQVVVLWALVVEILFLMPLLLGRLQGVLLHLAAALVVLDQAVQHLPYLVVLVVAATMAVTLLIALVRLVYLVKVMPEGGVVEVTHITQVAAEAVLGL
jgi:hypothetical protein